MKIPFVAMPGGIEIRQFRDEGSRIFCERMICEAVNGNTYELLREVNNM